MAQAFEALLSRLGRQHQRLMDELTGTVVEAFQAENKRLAEELAQSRRAAEELDHLRLIVGKKAKTRPRPPIPPLPPALALSMFPDCSEQLRTWVEPTCIPIRPWTVPSSGLVLACDTLPDKARPCEDDSAAFPRFRKGAYNGEVASWQNTERMAYPPGVIQPGEAFGCDGLETAEGDGDAMEQQVSIEPMRPTAAVGDVAPRSCRDANNSDGEAQGTRASFPRTRASTKSTRSSKSQTSKEQGLVGHMNATRMSRTDKRLTSKEKNRLRVLLGLKSGDELVTVDKLEELLQMRNNTSLDVLTLLGLFKELKRVARQAMPTSEAEERVPANCISLSVLTEFVVLSDLQEFVDPEMLMPLRVVIATLSITTVDEIIATATKTAASRPKKKGRFRWEGWLNPLVSVLAVVNVGTLGVSVDWQPDHFIWFIIDTVCAAVFVIEVLIKLHAYGLYGYFYTSESWQWNNLDFITTLISVLDWSISLSTQSDTGGALGDANYSGQVATTVRVIVLLRILRLVRLMRVVIIQSEVVRDLAKMLVGFVLGLPSLFWVLFLFGFVLYGVGLTFRLMIGPAQGQDLMSVCGEGDFHLTFNDPICKPHYLYGEEFFGTLTKSMFTTFRFMLGDCFSRQGNSLTTTFSEGYGKWFECVYVMFMIVVHFGFFNIITAIFVDSTTAGLKNNDATRKYTQQYEKNYVRHKLRLLIFRLKELCEEMDKENPQDMHLRVKGDGFELGVEDFVRVMEDHTVRRLLQDLDVDICRPELSFDIFDPEGDGVVTVSNMVKAVMKLRGGAQKNDVVAAGIAVRALLDKVDRLQLHLFEVQTRVEANYSKLIETLASAAPMSPMCSTARRRLTSTGQPSQVE